MFSKLYSKFLQLAPFCVKAPCFFKPMPYNRQRNHDFLFCIAVHNGSAIAGIHNTQNTNVLLITFQVCRSAFGSQNIMCSYLTHYFGQMSLFGFSIRSFEGGSIANSIHIGIAYPPVYGRLFLQIPDSVKAGKSDFFNTGEPVPAAMNIVRSDCSFEPSSKTTPSASNSVIFLPNAVLIS